MLQCEKRARSWQREYRRELLPNLRQRLRAVDDAATLRVGGGAREIGRAHALENSRWRALELVQGTPIRESLAADPDRNIEYKCEIRAKIIERHALHVRDQRRRNAMTAALISVCRIGEAIAQHQSALREPGPDLALAMLATRGKHQQCFGDMGHGLAKQKLAKTLAHPCPTRRARGRGPGGAPPGPRVPSSGRRRRARGSASHGKWVLLPAPSIPSRVIRRPRSAAGIESHREVKKRRSARAPSHQRHQRPLR